MLMMNIVILVLMSVLAVLFFYTLDRQALRHGIGLTLLHAVAGVVLANLAVQTILRGHNAVTLLPLFVALIAGFVFLQLLKMAARFE